MGEWKRHYRWRPQGGNTHTVAVHLMFTGALEMPVDVMYQHCDGCTHNHKSADPDTRKPRRENRGKLSGAPRRDDIPAERRAPPEPHGLFCWLRKVSWRNTMFMNGSFLNSSALDPSEQALHRPPWVTTTLGCFLIFTIVVDILGNLLVIFSVYRNKKLRNAGELRARACTRVSHLFHRNCWNVAFEAWTQKKIDQITTLTDRTPKGERARISDSLKSHHRCCVLICTPMFPLNTDIMYNWSSATKPIIECNQIAL